MQIEIITPPTGDVFTLAEVKGFLRLDVSDTSEDATLNLFIAAAIENFESYTGKVLRPTGFRITNNMINGNYRIDLIKSPVSAITLRQYDEGNGFVNSTDFRDYIDNYSYVVFEDYISYCRSNQFRVEFTAGYAEVPSLAKLAMLQYIAFMYENRGDCSCADTSNIPNFVKSNFNKFKTIRV